MSVDECVFVLKVSIGTRFDMRKLYIINREVGQITFFPLNLLPAIF